MRSVMRERCFALRDDVMIRFASVEQARAPRYAMIDPTMRSRLKHPCHDIHTEERLSILPNRYTAANTASFIRTEEDLSLRVLRFR